MDDDADFRDGLAWLLDSRGLPTRSWAGGDPFLQAVHSGEVPNACSVVLLDIRMEPLSGLATFEQLKAAGVTVAQLMAGGAMHGHLNWYPADCTPMEETLQQMTEFIVR
mgnify:CR=1 FL=1